jgi:transposase
MVDIYYYVSSLFFRDIDVYVDFIDLKSFDFKHVATNKERRPPYHPATLLRLHLYGHRYGIRSSRKLEYQSRYNLEVKWLLCGVMADTLNH